MRKLHERRWHAGLRGLGGSRFCVGAADVNPGDALRVGWLAWFNRAHEPEIGVIGMLDKIVDGVVVLGVLVEPSEFALPGGVEEDYQ
ncbi:MAG TPA: hypothetical protein VMV08_07305 [Gaiellaceae bacterium]|nr:hypothetical protein [Gaiellaceae bacterium]